MQHDSSLLPSILYDGTFADRVSCSSFLVSDVRLMFIDLFSHTYKRTLISKGPSTSSSSPFPSPSSFCPSSTSASSYLLFTCESSIPHAVEMLQQRASRKQKISKEKEQGNSNAIHNLRTPSNRMQEEVEEEKKKAGELLNDPCAMFSPSREQKPK